MEFFNGGGLAKTRMTPLPECQKVWRYVHLFRYNIAVERWRDRQTDRQTDRRICHSNTALCMHCMLMC